MPTYTPLQSIVLTSATSSVTFSGISQNYQDLILVANVAQVSSNNSLRYRFNGDTGSNYSDTYMYGNGTTAGSGRDTSQTSGTIYVTGSTTIETNYIVHFMNYSNATTYKTIIGRSNRAGSEVAADVGLWRSTSAINSISLAMGGSFPTNNFASGSTFDLYGISPAAANTAQAFGGTEVFYDSSYVYHVFKASGTFTPYRNLTADYLVVAGGGAGGGGNTGSGGGGGAGGLRSTVTATGGGGSLESALSLTSGTSYTVTVGAGGAHVANGRASGSNSVFSTITSTGGGGGGSRTAGNYDGAAGGSGGGGSGDDTARSGGAASPSGQGYGGGNGGGSSVNSGGGGGGAGAVGAARSGDNPGNGGNGVQITALATVTGTGANSGFYAGGGGGGALAISPLPNGGTGGSGGGGNGGGNNNSYLGVSGTANTGSGGGAGGNNGQSSTYGGNGGSGIVIVRYAR